jgi:murein L,D-transpeptidase YcbB/YkuD
MNSGEEYYCNHAQTKFNSVYIGYFTAWCSADGVVHFYEDVYKRDEALASLLFDKDKSTTL